MKKFYFIFIVLLLTTLTSCSSIFFAKSLKNYHVKSIRLEADSLLKIQDTPHQIGLTVVTQNNEIFKTKGILKGKLAWKNFILKAEGAKFTNGKLTILQTDSANYIPFIPISFYSVYQPDKVFRDTIPLNYEQNIKIFPTKKFQSFPGSKIPLGITVTYDNGIKQTFKSLNQIKNFENYYDVLVRSSSYGKSEFKISDDPLDIPEHISGVMIRSKFNHKIFDVFEVNVDYRNKFNYYANGRGGLSGFSGSSGSMGSAGQTGGNGLHGEYGDHGERGNDLDVYVDAYNDSILNKTMLKVFIGNIDKNETKRFLIDPNGGSLYISARGGDGGSGGSGGNGGNGGNGRDGETYTETVYDEEITKDTAGNEIRKRISRTITRQRPGENGGSGGNGGNGGDGGDGGNGGYVIVYYTAAAQGYLRLININTFGGSSGSAGSGGSAGYGGRGGSGNPNGSSGGNGFSGVYGYSGHSGQHGRVEYRITSEPAW